jgi:hypothetical protein
MENAGSVNRSQGAGRELTEEQLEQQRMLAMRAWELRERRTPRHPVYRARRIADSRMLMQHMIGSLLVLGALMLISHG